jgi:CRISPR system Cascade subunit CasD
VSGPEATSTATLLLRLAGPLQSWGTQSRFSVRDTGLEPSKSGVVGLLCAALGRARDEPLADLAALRMGVRADREGALKVDYHTAGGRHGQRDLGYGVPGPDGKGQRTVVSERFYLADADFLVGLEGERRLLDMLDAALLRPRWQLCLGRKAFVPSAQVRVGVVPDTLETALTRHPWLGADQAPLRRRADAPASLRIVWEPADGSGPETRMDVPLSFAERRFSARTVETTYLPLDELQKVSST